ILPPADRVSPGAGMGKAALRGTSPRYPSSTKKHSLLKRIRQERQLRVVLEHFLTGFTDDLNAYLPIYFIGYYILPLFRGQPMKTQLHFGDTLIFDAANRSAAVATDILDCHDRQPPAVRCFPSIMAASAGFQSSRSSPVKPVHRLVEGGDHPLVNRLRRLFHRVLDQRPFLPGKGGQDVIRYRHRSLGTADADFDPLKLLGFEMMDQGLHPPVSAGTALLSKPQLPQGQVHI